MKRLHRILVLVVPGLIAGALIASSNVGEAQPTPTPAPAPRPAPSRGVVELPPEARDQIRAELDRAMAELDANPDLPPKMRARLHKALAKARAANMKDLAMLGEAMRQLSAELEGLGEELQAELPGIQQEIEAALRHAGVLRHAGKVKIAGPGADPWAVVVGDDDHADDDEHGDFDVDVDVDNGSVTIRRGADPDGPAGPWTRRWQGMTPPVPPVPPAPPAPPAPPTPPAPPALDHSDPFDVDVQVQFPSRDSLSDRKVQQLRSIADAAGHRIDEAKRVIAAKSQALEQLVADPDADIDDVEALVDEISREEAKLHKARLRALIEARKTLGHD